ncbi:MAG: hypothetical protein HYZ11_01165 [Candidatus Tectomicrobia bacterium]|uniref:Uncharacterized protein n=1 Tax=Tectimicrobiota bacterium TaxID=2528274 RepID=A0A932HXG1_UNCTE|nr:hypothetical protein [Candidatus Tectomicrobia bacterium]
MRYLVRARVKPGREEALLKAVESGALGRGSIAHGEFLRCMEEARLTEEGQVRWLEVCYCREAFGPGQELAEELPYWREYFEAIDIRFARRLEDCEGYPHCGGCDCTLKLEARLAGTGRPFLGSLRGAVR